MNAELCLGAQVTFRADSEQFARCAGLVWTIMSDAPMLDRTDAATPRPFVWIELTDDIMTRSPSRRRGRNAYLDALMVVTS